jgi:hypothetical protein
MTSPSFPTLAAITLTSAIFVGAAIGAALPRPSIAITPAKSIPETNGTSPQPPDPQWNDYILRPNSHFHPAVIST